MRPVQWIDLFQSGVVEFPIHLKCLNRPWMMMTMMIQDFEATWPLGPGLIELPMLVFSPNMEWCTGGVPSVSQV